MASALSVALRRQEALQRILEVLNVDTSVQSRDPAMREAVTLERIAEAVEALSKRKTTKKATTDGD
jgi:L-fucose mutarotase/ribose pyranase (RbsD/FucU family)